MKMAILIEVESTCWPALACPEAPASCHASASSPLYRLAENIGFAAIVMAKLKLGEIERQIFGTEIVIGADHAAFEQIPKALDIVGMHLAAHVFVCPMRDHFVPIEMAQVTVSARFIGRDQANLFGHGLFHEAAQRIGGSVLDDPANNIALAGDRADDRHLASVSRAAAVVLLAVLPVPVFLLAANVRFVHFNDPHQLLEVGIVHRSAESHAHVPSRAIGTETDHAVNLKRAHTFLAGEHEVQDFEPSAKRNFGFLENGSSLEREAIGRAVILAAFLALPMPRAGRAFINVIVAASRAAWAARPSAQEQISPATRLIGKEPIELSERHLADEARFSVFVIAHASDISANRRGSQESHNPPPLVSLARKLAYCWVTLL
jgi:hypothetical protein